MASRILHGTFSTLGGSYVMSRNSLAELTAGLLRAYAWYLHRYQAAFPTPEDNAGPFLDWVRTQTSKAA